MNEVVGSRDGQAAERCVPVDLSVGRCLCAVIMWSTSQGKKATIVKCILLASRFDALPGGQCANVEAQLPSFSNANSTFLHPLSPKLPSIKRHRNVADNVLSYEERHRTMKGVLAPWEGTSSESRSQRPLAGDKQTREGDPIHPVDLCDDATIGLDN